MKIVYKGKYKGVDTLPKGNLPDNAVKFKEPSSALQLNLVAALFAIPLIIVIIMFIAIKMFVFGADASSLHDSNIWGYLLAILFIIPHELLHAVCFPRDAEVEVYYSNWGAFVVSTYPVTKLRFIMISLCPNLLFGIAPLILWLFLPSGIAVTNFVFSFAFISLLLGCGDLMNVFNALTQMPKGTYQQLSGFNSYWFYPLTHQAEK